jgi:UDP-N-acetylmuramate: L-alanyl-gamma-D-glutamyl-meso-diaminopimelate ligase
MKIHFIAIGGSAMHNLAIALHKKDFLVTGSDDEVFEPSKTRLQKHNLLPSIMGWHPDRITTDLDAVILGMHARPDNPELLKAQELGIRVYSYPEYLYQQTKQKKRVVIAGSHGKTTITSMLLHVLKTLEFKFDFMVGAQIKGFDTMVELSDESDVAIFEGDEYLSSPIDKRPKFLWYRPHIALITGVAWDHINVFPTQEAYNEQFYHFAETIESGGTLVYQKNDAVLCDVARKFSDGDAIPYDVVASVNQDGKTVVREGDRDVGLQIFGQHNLQNLAGALAVARKLGISEADFFDTMQSFEGADRRLQVLAESDDATVFFDFAHAPSKVTATVAAVKEQFPSRRLFAVIELHTFSSLNRDFLPQYKGTLTGAGEAIVFFNPQVVAHKRLPEISIGNIKKAFGYPGLKVFTDPAAFVSFLNTLSLNKTNLLLMSSGNLAGLDVNELARKVIKK